MMYESRRSVDKRRSTAFVPMPPGWRLSAHGYGRNRKETQMMIQAVLSNPSHPEYGVATIPFPIPRDQYAHCMDLLEALEIGDAVKTDCKVEKVDSFDTGEAAQFQAMAHKLELFELKDLINLSFCCQQATVITDFSDLAAVGRDHYMNLHGGSASVDELNALDGEETARQLIESGGGTITPYGVVYDNGMKLERVYDGRFFPCCWRTWMWTWSVCVRREKTGTMTCARSTAKRKPRQHKAVGVSSFIQHQLAIQRLLF